VWVNPIPSIFNLKAYIDWEKSEEIQPVYNYFMDRYYPKNVEGFIESKTLFWGDVIWESDVIIDIQNLFITSNILNKIWLEWKYEIRLNFIWIKKEIEKYKEKLQDFYSDKKHLLTEQWLEYFENDILKLLSSNDEDEKILAKSAPSIEKSYKKNSKKDIVKIKDYLEILKIDYIFDNTLFGDYDFNDGVIWEIKLKWELEWEWELERELKWEWEILAKGYWYNELSNFLLEPKEIPWSWFWVDVFKVIDILKNNNITILNKDKLDLFFVQLWDDAKKVVLPLSLAAREAWINTAISLWTPSMKEQMLKAGRSGATYVVMVWLMEAKNWVFQVRNNVLWTQEEVRKEDLIEYVIGKIWKDALDFYDPSRDLLEK
jgi:histidyl-tRNA synthetase